MNFLGDLLHNGDDVMNYFIERQDPDKFNPDVVKIKPGEKNKDGTPKVHKPTPSEVTRMCNNT